MQLCGPSEAVRHVHGVRRYAWSDVLALAAAVEAASEHPLATAVLATANNRGLHVVAGTSARALPAAGVRATVDGHTVFVGRPQHAAPARLEEQRTALEQAGKTTAMVAVNGQAIGTLAIADQLRPDAVGTVRSLHQMGISRVVMLSGDNTLTARAVARTAGIDDCRAELLPEHKATAIAQLRHDLGEVAIVGDGINDAPALATADIGIAMGTASTDVALETPMSRSWPTNSPSCPRQSRSPAAPGPSSARTSPCPWPPLRCSSPPRSPASFRSPPGCSLTKAARC